MCRAAFLAEEGLAGVHNYFFTFSVVLFLFLLVEYRYFATFATEYGTIRPLPHSAPLRDARRSGAKDIKNELDLSAVALAPIFRMGLLRRGHA